MAGQTSVRASRDGDQFHYNWAARRCLELLPGDSDLVAVTIEGPSATEGAGIEAGEELIDVGFYYGAENRSSARRVHYVQLKHSTLQGAEHWTASGLKSTLEGFAERYGKLVAELSLPVVAERFRLSFTTNRPIHSDVAEALADLAAGIVPRHPALQAQLINYTGLDTATAPTFFALFTADGKEDDLWAQQNLLVQDLWGYLPEADLDAPVQLKELVTRKATTEFKSNPSIRRNDVLRALKATEDTLTPAPSLIAEPARELAREQEPDILAALLKAQTPLIIHAEGGVGKSILAARLARAMPTGSVAVLYDCYGDGLYRTALNARHRHRDALVQIANELAAQGLCHPLIPSAGADAKAYMKAFLFRLKQASTVIRARVPDASLCIIVDAADNAQMAAHDLSELASFVPDLIRAPMPTGVRLAVTCRTHRRDKLDAPLDAVPIELKSFSRGETSAHLRGIYPAATDSEVAEFAVLSSDNPRVQALAMSRGLSLPDMLRRLGPTPTTVDQVLAELLNRAIAELKDRHGPTEAARIDRLCQALAILRPLVPIAVLARLAEMSESEVRTFALGVGRPLFVKGGSLHFLDEPAEIWFREQFRPDARAMADLLDRLRPLTAESSYAAAVLPELLLLAGRLDELVDLALSGDGLPSDPIARRDVELQRLIFALKACLQLQKALPAAKLALKAAGETAGEERQTQLIQDNTDIAAVLLTPDRLEEIVARRPFGSDWMGSHHAYDAGLLSGRDELAPEASSRLRMAMDWFETWARTPRKSDHDREEVSDHDRAELAMTLFRLRSPEAAAQFLRRWRPRRVALTGGYALARRLFDVGSADQVDSLAFAAGNDVWLLLGLASASREVGHSLPRDVIGRLMRLLADRRVLLPSDQSGFQNRWDLLEAVTSAVEMALLSRGTTPKEAADILARYIPAEPPHDMTSRYGVDHVPLLRAYALHAALSEKPMSLIDIAPERSRAQLEASNSYGHDQDTEFFKHEIGGLLPWFVLCAELICDRPPPDLGEAIETARKATASAEHRLYDQVASAWQTAALRWFEILKISGTTGRAAYPSFVTWISDPKTQLWPSTTISLCRQAARSVGLADLALTLSSQAFEALDRSREDADSRLANFTKLSRAILPVSPAEASAFFDRAVAFASQIGQENLERWDALLNLGLAAFDPSQPKPCTAHRFSRVAELTYEYVARDKHFDWDRTVQTLVDLCPSSAFAILSRWRDRRFGYQGRLLPLAVERLVEQARLPIIAPIALAGIDSDWDRLGSLQAVGRGITDPSARSTALQIAYRYLRITPRGPDTWADVKRLGDEVGFSFADVDRLLRAAEREQAPQAKKTAPSEQAEWDKDRKAPDWETIFSGVDFSDAEALRSAYLALRSYDPPWRFDEFFSQALARVGAGREPELVRAVVSWPNFDRFDLRSLLDALPKPLPARLALKAAVRDAVLEICRRNPDHIWRRGWSVTIPFEKLEAQGVLTDAEVVAALVEGFAARVDHLGADSLFRAVDALAAMLSPAEADEALNYGMDLLEELLGPDDADGPWRPGLNPPASLPPAFAGYIWAGLGSPAAEVRWQCAHAVRAVVELGWSEILEALLVWAQGEGAAAFVDQGLEFYLWHARQWLTIGLARAALSAPSAMASAVPLLRAWAALPHVLIREMAAEALARLAAGGVITKADSIDPEMVNRPVQGIRRFQGWGYTGGEHDEAQPDETDSDEKYSFGIDIGPYWFSGLGRAFGIGEASIEKRARAVVRGRLGWAGGGWRDDMRRTRQLFRDDEARHSHGSLPRSEDLQAYHGYHAMMIVAADLLETHQVRHREDEDQNEFDDWLDNYRLTRSDGQWLADRRDPRLVADPAKIEHEEAVTWRWAVTRDYLDAQLSTDQGDPVVWGYWHGCQGDQTETVSVRSALVARQTADSLVAALQTAKELGRHSLPDADYSDDIKVGAYQCAGWIHDSGRDRKLDEFDIWSERLHWPDPAPRSEIISALALTLGADGRAWRDQTGGALTTESWTREVGYGRDTEIDAGWRVSANREFLKSLFRARPETCLLLTVSIQRNPSRYESKKNDFVEYPWPYQLHYLMGPDGVAVAF